MEVIVNPFFRVVLACQQHKQCTAALQTYPACFVRNSTVEAYSLLFRIHTYNVYLDQHWEIEVDQRWLSCEVLINTFHRNSVVA